MKAWRSMCGAKGSNYLCLGLGVASIGVTWTLGIEYVFLLFIQLLHLAIFAIRKKSRNTEWRQKIIRIVESMLVVLTILSCFIVINTVFLIGFLKHRQKSYANVSVYALSFLYVYTIAYVFFGLVSAIRVFSEKAAEDDGETSSGIIQRNQLLNINSM